MYNKGPCASILLSLLQFVATKIIVEWSRAVDTVERRESPLCLRRRHLPSLDKTKHLLFWWRARRKQRPPLNGHLSTKHLAVVRFSVQGKCLLFCLGPVEFVMVVIAHVEFEGKLRESAASSSSSSSCGCCSCFSCFICSIWRLTWYPAKRRRREEGRLGEKKKLQCSVGGGKASYFVRPEIWFRSSGSWKTKSQRSGGGGKAGRHGRRKLFFFFFFLTLAEKTLQTRCDRRTKVSPAACF